MNDRASRILCEITMLHGRDVADDPRRLRALLSDLCPDLPQEMFVLVSAAEQRIPRELVAAHAGLPWQAVSGRLVQRFCNATAIDPKAAEWAVAAWATALGKHEVQVPDQETVSNRNVQKPDEPQTDSTWRRDQDRIEIGKAPQRKRVWLKVSLGIATVVVLLSGVAVGWYLIGREYKQKTLTVETLTVEFADGEKMDFVLIPKGKFQMGSPADEKERNPISKSFDAEKLHDVEISKPFYLAKYTVTQKQYQALMKDNPSYFQAGKGGADKVKGLDTDQFPVESVSWDDAQAFCKKMTNKDKQSRKFRLPTEAEWEYACRAGTKTAYFFGDDPQKLVEYAWFGDYLRGRTHKVGEKNQPNAWGLHDMHGNVWQWCADYYGPYNDDLKSNDPLRSIKHDEERRVLRGGSWRGTATTCRAAFRNDRAPDDANSGANSDSGFRVAFRLD